MSEEDFDEKLEESEDVDTLNDDTIDDDSLD